MFVALVQQGMVLDQKVVQVGDDKEAVLQQAEQEAEKRNAGVDDRGLHGRRARAALHGAADRRQS